MKAMLDPVIAATSTQRFAAAVHGVAAAPWWIAASSQGGFSVTLIAGRPAHHAGAARVAQREGHVGLAVRAALAIDKRAPSRGRSAGLALEDQTRAKFCAANFQLSRCAITADRCSGRRSW
jgi:hypothetical protein